MGGFFFDFEVDRDAPRRCRELAGKLSRGDVTHETAKDLSDDDGYLHSDDEGITDLPLASSLVEHALDALVEQGEVKKSGDDYALVVDDDGDWRGAASRRNRVDTPSLRPETHSHRVDGVFVGPRRRDVVDGAAKRDGVAPRRSKTRSATRSTSTSSVTCLML